jgi:hypothetical protein
MTSEPNNKTGTCCCECEAPLADGTGRYLINDKVFCVDCYTKGHGQ